MMKLPSYYQQLHSSEAYVGKRNTQTIHISQSITNHVTPGL